jgi:hypothetical protein
MKMQDWTAIRLRINEVDDRVRDILSTSFPRVTAYLPKIPDDSTGSLRSMNRQSQRCATRASWASRSRFIRHTGN